MTTEEFVDTNTVESLCKLNHLYLGLIVENPEAIEMGGETIKKEGALAPGPGPRPLSGIGEGETNNANINTSKPKTSAKAKGKSTTNPTRIDYRVLS